MIGVVGGLIGWIDLWIKWQGWFAIKMHPSPVIPIRPKLTDPQHLTSPTTRPHQNHQLQIQLQTTIPVIFGVLTCMDEGQAKARSTGENNHGISWGKTAVEMALMRTAALSKAPERVRGGLILWLIGERARLGPLF